MTLLNGFLATFAALGAVPIIIHLLNRRRFKVVVWAAMEFLLATMEKNSRRLQIQDLILMMLRALAIVFLALALARPTIAPGRLSLLGGRGEIAAVILLDNSLSMDYHGGREKRYDTAQRMARTVVEILPKGSAAALVLMSDMAVDEIPEPSHDLAFVGAEIRKAPLSDAGTDVVEGLARALEILEKVTATSREIYLITDLQANAWPAPDAKRWGELTQKIASSQARVKLFVMDAGDGGRQNVSIESLAPEDELITTETKVAFVATLRNHGPTPAEGVLVELHVGEEGAPAMRKVASLVVDQVETVHTVRLETRFARGGNHRIAVRIGIDRLLADNSRYVSVDVLERVRVLLIDGQPAEGDDAFGGETDFLKAALSPLDFDSDERKTLIESEVTTVYGLGGKRLRDYHAVILANVGSLPPGLVEGLKTFVRARGGGLLIFLGDNVRPDRYNELLFTGAGLLPGRLGARLIEETTGEDEGFGIATDELSHPIVSFFASKENQPFLAKPRFSRAFHIQLDAPSGGNGSAAGAGKVQVVARFTGGQPAIVERKFGRGSVILFASTADKDWTDFPLHAAFLPVIRRATQHVTLGRRPRKTIQVHEPIVDFLSVRDAGALVTVRDPRGRARQVSATLSATGDLAQVNVGDTHFAGFYELTLGGDDPRTSYFAANPPRTESDLDALGEKALRKKYPGLEFQWISRRDDLRRVIIEERVGREIWPFLLALTFVCLLLESILAVRWAPREA